MRVWRAVLAALDMTAERRRAAALDRRHDLQLAEAHMAGMGRTPSRPVVAEDVRDLDRRPRQRPRVSRASSSRKSSGLVTWPIVLMATRV